MTQLRRREKALRDGRDDNPKSSAPRPIPRVYWPFGGEVWQPCDMFFIDLYMAEKYHKFPWEVRQLDSDNYRAMYYNLELLLTQVKSEFDYEERKEQEREAKRHRNRR